MRTRGPHRQSNIPQGERGGNGESNVVKKLGKPILALHSARLSALAGDACVTASARFDSITISFAFNLG
jgi:hypothetical protein